jgi:hypothetical protein
MLQSSKRVLDFVDEIGSVLRTSMRQRMFRLDRIASEMNAWLLAVAIGLGMLDLTVLVAKSLPALPQMAVPGADASVDQPVAAPPPSPSAAARN